MADEAAAVGEGVTVERIAYVRKTVRVTLDDQLAVGKSAPVRRRHCTGN